MAERLRIQKQMSHIEEGFPHLAKYLAGWPASTHGTQVLGLAEMKAKEILTGNPGSAVYALAPGAGDSSTGVQSGVSKVDGGKQGRDEGQKFEPLKDVEQTKKDEGSSFGRRKINLRGLPIDE